jgi:serine/threonine protein kinase
MSVVGSSFVRRQSNIPAGRLYSAAGASEMAQTMTTLERLETVAEPRVVAERYELLARLPHGGMGVVFRGWDRELRRPVAVKTLQLSGASQDNLLATRRPWWWEAWVMAAVRHPHVVTVYEAFRDRTHGYIVMELMEGYNLKRYLSEMGSLPLEEGLTIAIQVGHALAALHEHGFLHCDVKPHNILRSSIGWVKLADFGIAQEIHPSQHGNACLESRLAEQSATSDNFIGTPAYCSPEQALCEPLSVATDIYSLGVVLYELLVGAPPFNSEAPLKILTEHALAQPPTLRSVRPDAPEIVERLILQAMAKRPDQRFASTQAMCVALEYARTVVIHASQSRVWRRPPSSIPFSRALVIGPTDERESATAVNAAASHTARQRYGILMGEPMDSVDDSKAQDNRSAVSSATISSDSSPIDAPAPPQSKPQDALPTELSALSTTLWSACAIGALWLLALLVWLYQLHML